MNSRNTTVISLGGSLIAPSGTVDVEFMRRFKSVVMERIPERQFCIITGGGGVAREYQAALGDLQDAGDETLDWMGIYATRLNGHFSRLLFADVAHEEVVLTPEAAMKAEAPVVIGAAGDTPGNSSDLGTVDVAHAFGADHLINLSNTSHVYTADPATHEDAEKLEKLSWDEYLDIIPSEWTPGLHTPFDPVSSRRAKEYELEVAIMDGANIENLERYLDGGEFSGTTIYPV